MKDPIQLEEALQDCLEAMIQGGQTLDQALARYPHLRQELLPLLESALWVRSQRADFSPSPQRRAALQERVLKSIQTQPLPHVQAAARPRWSSRPARARRLAWLGIAATLVFLSLLVFTTTGMALAAQNSLPGDPLYAVKEAVEEARVLLTWDAAQRARLRLAYAERRLAEVARLSQRGRVNENPLPLRNYEVQLALALQEVESAARQNPLQASQLKAEIEAGLQTQAASLVALESLLPPVQAAAVRQAQDATFQTLQAVDALLTEMAATLTPNVILSAPVSGTDAGWHSPLLPFSTPTASFIPPGLLRQTQSPTPRASLTPHPTNTHRPTQVVPPTKTPKPTQIKPPVPTPKPTQVKPPKPTPKPTQVKPPKPTPKPTNPNKPTDVPQPPGQSKPTKTPKK